MAQPSAGVGRLMSRGRSLGLPDESLAELGIVEDDAKRGAEVFHELISFFSDLLGVLRALTNPDEPWLTADPGP
jgi:hypothetical protein